ncbi:alpha/beta family hydrolase [Rheinheimera sp. 4Y26]|uniref:alpha/beta family hydrolase n=1 Tax=Rheinheimera sp. 4Y26 TaxID=2977811 RepID=UPI0021B11D72|nr:alpha/beta family hydrolase [Rheinheimera sp. 4Y26]MCT6700329.1 alpha/beta hydrolase [Rheinheimera sp. 4Y26]
MNSDIFLITPADKPVARMLLLHGAGAAVQSQFLSLLAQELALQGIEVWRVNFAYMQKSLQGQKQPPSKVAVLQQELVAFIGQLPNDLPLLVGGKSMGGRVATLLAAAEDEPSLVATAKLRAICCFGYPFCPPAKKTQGIGARTEHFPMLKLPVLIVQGERDEFGGKAQLSDAPVESWPQLNMHWLPFGDHDLASLKKHPLSQQQLIMLAATACRDFINAKILAN